MDPRGFLNLRQAAEVAQVGHETIRRWAMRGCPVNGHIILLACEVVGSRYRITPEAIEQFKVDCTAAARNEPVRSAPPALATSEQRRADADQAEMMAELGMV